MSKIEELIKEKCPNGVEYKKLYEVTIWDKKFNNTTKEMQPYTTSFKHVSASFLKELLESIGNVKLISTGQFEGLTTYEKAEQYINRNEIISIPSGGSANIKYYNGDFVDSGNILAISKNEKLFNLKYVYYNLINNNSFIEKFYRGSGVRHPDMIKILNIRIPVPPKEVQEGIVEILDKFSKLEVELEAELEARKNQYEFWYAKLFDIKNVEYRKLNELCNIVDYRGKTPKKVDDGVYLVTAKNIKMGYIDYNCSKEYIAYEDYEDVMRRGKPLIGDVLFTTEAPCGHVAQVDNEKIALAQRVIKYSSNNKKILNNNYLKYVLLSKNFQERIDASSNGSTVKGIKGSKLHNLTIPMPSLKEQDKIVKILDKFDKLINDINFGIPAEIELRRKQYEFYRNKLLSFKIIEGSD